MKKIRILLINHYAGSAYHGMEYRPFQLAREWIRHGCDVTILAASFSHLRNHQPDMGAHGKVIQDIDGIRYIWYQTPSYRGNGLKRAYNIWTFCRHVWQDSDALSKEVAPDVVIASSTYPMDIWIASRIARRSNAKLIYEIHDLWPLSLIELGGMSRLHPFVVVCGLAEKRAYREADCVVSMLPLVQEHVVRHGLSREKLVIVPNGISPVEWTGQTPAVQDEVTGCIRRFRDQNRLVVGYTGAHGMPNALDTVLDAAKMLTHDPFAFVMIGNGHERERLAERVAGENISGVVMFPAVSRDRMPALLQSFDILYIGLQNQPLFRFGISPNKLMDYMMAGRPVLCAIRAGNDPVSEAGCGLTIEPESPQAIVQGLRDLAELSPEERDQMGRRGREYILKHHSYPVLAGKFLDIMRKIV
jgi:glycosyltransferase involved in cell wall biosynthesis